MMDEKKEKFNELATKRMKRALDAIRLVGNLSNTYSYSYGEADAGLLLKSLRDAVSEVEGRFDKALGKDKSNFHF